MSEVSVAGELEVVLRFVKDRLYEMKTIDRVLRRAVDVLELFVVNCEEQIDEMFEYSEYTSRGGFVSFSPPETDYDEDDETKIVEVVVGTIAEALEVHVDCPRLIRKRKPCRVELANLQRRQ